MSRFDGKAAYSIALVALLIGACGGEEEAQQGAPLGPGGKADSYVAPFVGADPFTQMAEAFTRGLPGECNYRDIVPEGQTFYKDGTCTIKWLWLHFDNPDGEIEALRMHSRFLDEVQVNEARGVVKYVYDEGDFLSRYRADVEVSLESGRVTSLTSWYEYFSVEGEQLVCE